MEKINKRSGNKRRACKKRYQKIIANNPEIVGSNLNGSMLDTTKLIPPSSQNNSENNSMDVQHLESVDTSSDVVNDDRTTTDEDEETIHLFSENEKIIGIREELLT